MTKKPLSIGRKLKLKSYQKKAKRFILSRPYYAIFADPGMGKTAIALAAIRTLNLQKVLIVAPLMVITHVWPSEINKWHRFRHLKFSRAIDKKNTRIHLVNPESLHKVDTKIDYDAIIIDESTAFKNPSGVRFKTLCEIIKWIPRRIILTGTPTPKSVMDLWSQIFLLDFGKSLYTKVTHFRQRYFDCDLKSVGSYRFPKYTPHRNAYKNIIKKIAAFTIRIEDTKSKEPLINDIVITLDPKEQKHYKSMEKSLFSEIQNQSVYSVNAAVAYNACHQLANGAIYDDRKEKFLTLHNAKLDALERLIDELHGKPLIVGYTFKHDLTRLRKRFKNAVPITAPNAIEDWNNGKIDLLLAQLQSASKGLNLYLGGKDICFFSLTDNYENYIQFIRRIWGINRNRSVRVHRIITDKTVDVAIVRRLNDRDSAEKSFLEYLKIYRNRKSYNQ